MGFPAASALHPMGIGAGTSPLPQSDHNPRGQPGSGDTSGGVTPARDIVGPGKWGKIGLEEGTLTQELFQQFPPCSSAVKREPAAACALPAGASSPPRACPILEQTPAARSGQ